MATTPTREELCDQLKKLELRRAHIVEHTRIHGADKDTTRELRAIKLQIRLISIELSKFKTERWREDPDHFCRAFKQTARRELDVETYEMLVHKTALRLKLKHGYWPKPD
jgi:ribosomal protein S15P/S13E